MGVFDVAFVDSITASPTVRLSLSSSVWTVRVDGTEFPPPPLDRVVVQNPMFDGATIPASAYGPREIILSLDLAATLSDDDAATHLQALSRELDRKDNLLRYQSGTSKPVFFRTFRSDFAQALWDAAIRVRRFTIRLLAEPFALGLLENASGSPFTVPNNPASAGGGDFSVDGVLGDVETPAIIRITTAHTSGRFIVGMRRRDVSSTIPLFVQCEAGTNGADTSTVADGAMSGGSKKRTTFATDTSRVDRVTLTFPPSGSESAEHRGRYRLLARVQKTVSADVITVAPSIGDVEQQVTTLPLVSSAHVVDMGLFTFGGIASEKVGYSSIVLPPNQQVELRAGRTSGSGSLDWDWAMFVPADDILTMLSWSGPAGSDVKVLDAMNDTTYVTWDDPVTNPASKIRSDVITRDGGLPMLMPGRENRFIVSGSRLNTLDTLTDSSTWTISYYPAWINVARPA